MIYVRAPRQNSNEYRRGPKGTAIGDLGGCENAQDRNPD